jgi:hypothetical protein
MTILILRTQKGAPLTFAEVDANFLALAEAIESVLTGQIFTDNAIADNAGINPAKIAGTAVVAGDPRLSDQRVPADGSVTNAKIPDNAGIAPNKIAGTAVITIDARLSNQRVPVDESVTNVKVAADAAIEGTKIVPDFGDQPISTTGPLAVDGVTTIEGLATFFRDAPVAANTTSALTAAGLRSGLITSNPISPITLILPSAASLGADFPDAYGGMTFSWSLINLAATDAASLAPATGHDLVGAASVAAGTSALFLTRRATAGATFTTYRAG